MTSWHMTCHVSDRLSVPPPVSLTSTHPQLSRWRNEQEDNCWRRKGKWSRIWNMWKCTTLNKQIQRGIFASSAQSLFLMLFMSPVFPIIRHLYRRYCQVCCLLRHFQTSSEKLLQSLKSCKIRTDGILTAFLTQRNKTRKSMELPGTVWTKFSLG